MSTTVIEQVKNLYVLPFIKGEKGDAGADGESAYVNFEGDPDAVDNVTVLQELITAAAGEHTVIAMKGGIYRFNSINSPSNIHFVVYPDSMLSANSGEVMDIQGVVIRLHPYSQCFAGSGTFTGCPHQDADPTMFGAGHELDHFWIEENDLAALQAAVNLAKSGSKSVVIPPKKFYVYHDSNTVEGTSIYLDSDCDDMTIKGFGINSIIEIHGYTNGITVSDSEDIDNLTISGLQLIGDSDIDGSLYPTWGINCYMDGDAKLNRLKIENIVTHSWSGSGGRVHNARYSSIRNIVAYSNQYHGFSTVDFYGFVDNIEAYDNQEYGFDASALNDDVPSNIEMTNIYSHDNGWGIKTAFGGDGSVFKLSNARFENNINGGIGKARTGVSIQMHNIRCKNNGGQALNGYCGAAGLDEYVINDFVSEGDNDFTEVSTTVNQNSAAGQKVLYVASVANIAAKAYIGIDEGGAAEEWAFVVSVDAGNSLLNLKDNLAYSHNAVDAHNVKKLKANGTVYFDENCHRVQITDMKIKSAGNMTFVTQCPNNRVKGLSVEGNKGYHGVRVTGAGGGTFTDLEIRNGDATAGEFGYAGMYCDTSGNVLIHGGYIGDNRGESAIQKNGIEIEATNTGLVKMIGIDFSDTDDACVDGTVGGVHQFRTCIGDTASDES